MINLEIGSTVGDYQVIGILGAGGMGKVYKVRNVISDRVEAMKVLLPDLATEPDLADRFVREIKVQASLEHPHIAALHTALRIENQLIMLMEFVEGETLEQKLDKGPLPVPEAVDYISQVLSALGYAHEHGVVHRDIKPANMMLTPGGVIKLMDFGIAKLAGDRRLTSTGATMGSLYYMSPEQINGVATIDLRTDLYSVGVSLYELVTGRRPFDGDSEYAIMSAHLEKMPVPPLELDPGLPAALNDIILMSVAKNPNQRFQTAEAFRNALANIVPQPAADGPIAPPRRTTATGKPRVRRGLWLATGALAAVLAIVAVIQFGPWKKTSASDGGFQQLPPTQAPVNRRVRQPAAQGPVSEPVAPPVVPYTRTAPLRQQFQSLPPMTKAPRRSAAAPVPERQQQITSPVQAPVAQPPQTAPQVAQQPAMQPAPPREDPAKRAELQRVREQLVMLGARASSARDSMNNLARSQAASGLGMRGDIKEAASLMNSFLEGARDALNAGDAAAAKGFMEKAEAQVEKLEKFLGR